MKNDGYAAHGATYTGGAKDGNFPTAGAPSPVTASLMSRAPFADGGGSALYP